MEQRKIKFRGMTLKGEWVYGLLAHTNCLKGEAAWYISNSVGKPLAYEIRPETVSQWTGLQDREGRDIYESDRIWHSKYQKELVVTWNQDGCGWNLGDMALSKLCVPNLEVVGNIYEQASN